MSKTNKQKKRAKTQRIRTNWVTGGGEAEDHLAPVGSWRRQWETWDGSGGSTVNVKTAGSREYALKNVV